MMAFVSRGDNLKYMCTAGIKLATKYEYRLKAFCGGAHSQWSDVLTVETKGNIIISEKY